MANGFGLLIVQVCLMHVNGLNGLVGHFVPKLIMPLPSKTKSPRKQKLLSFLVGRNDTFFVPIKVTLINHGH